MKLRPTYKLGDLFHCFGNSRAFKLDLIRLSCPGVLSRLHRLLIGIWRWWRRGMDGRWLSICWALRWSGARRERPCWAMNFRFVFVQKNWTKFFNNFIFNPTRNTIKNPPINSTCRISFSTITKSAGAATQQRSINWRINWSKLRTATSDCSMDRLRIPWRNSVGRSGLIAWIVWTAPIACKLWLGWKCWMNKLRWSVWTKRSRISRDLRRFLDRCGCEFGFDFFKAFFEDFFASRSNGNEVSKIYAGTGAMGAGSKVICREKSTKLFVENLTKLLF